MPTHLHFVWRFSFGLLLLLISFSLIQFSNVGRAQTWETAANHRGDDQYFLPPYPVVFVAARINEEPNGGGLDGKYHIGTDVLSANNPDRDNHLWILLPSGQVKKLFPLNSHQQAGLIDTPSGQLDKGSVVEPNVSEDGTKVYFSYFHDTTFESSFSFGLNRLPLKGADLYSMNLGPLLADNNEDPANLPVQRLTFREYDAQGKQTDEDKYKNAMNQPLANNTAPNDWGTVYMHAVEMRTATGLKVVYASDERRVKNSNQEMAIGHANHNFNLHIADLASDGGLTNPRQFHYYTTTSVMSPLRSVTELPSPINLPRLRPATGTFRARTPRDGGIPSSDLERIRSCFT